MSDLAELIARLEKATGPSRELDVLTFRTTLDIPEGSRVDLGTDGVGYWPPGKAYVSYREAPRYTASLDAALSLVPTSSDTGDERGASIKIKWHDKCVTERTSARGQSTPQADVRIWLWGFNGDGGGIAEGIKDRQAALAIALCIAALRARASATPTSAEGGRNQ